TETAQGDITLLKISGDLDQMYEEEMTRRIEDLAARSCTRIVIDMCDLVLIDSAGVGRLVLLFKRMRAMNGDVKLSGVRGQPKELFKLLRLDRAFDVHDSVDAAVNAFRAPRA